MSEGNFSYQELREIFHEFKQPITVIKSWLDLLHIQVGDHAAAQKTLAIITANVDKIWHSVDDFMHVAVLTSTQQPLEPINLAQVIYEESEALSAFAAERGITFMIPPLHNLPPVLAAAGGMQSIVGNLFSNAIKYNRTGGTVTVTVERHPGWLWLHVADQGEGIAEADQPHIFLPLYRAPAIRSTIEGTGLGLALVKRLVDRYGGVVSFTSQREVGTTFTLKFPVQSIGLPAVEAPDGVADDLQEGTDHHAVESDRREQP